MALLPRRIPGLSLVVGYLLCSVAVVWSVVPLHYLGRAVADVRLAPTRLALFVAGAVVGAGLFALVRRRPRVEYLSTFAHELDHMIVALLLWRNVSEFVATRQQGGHVRHEYSTARPLASGLGNAVIALAPYTFPLAALVVTILAFVVGGGYPSPRWAAAMGAAVGLHIGIAIEHAARNLRTMWRGGEFTDFTVMGVPRSLGWTWATNALLVAALLGAAVGGRAGLASMAAALRHDTVTLAHYAVERASR